MRVDENVYKQMPEHLKRLFVKLPNPAKDEVVREFPQTGVSKWGKVSGRQENGFLAGGYNNPRSEDFIGDSGSAARFFKSCPYEDEDLAYLPPFYYTAKASKKDRNSNVEDEQITELNNRHPTVKPTSLLQYLCRLVTPEGGIILDPFAGSGSTLVSAKREGFGFIGFELENEYCEIANERIRKAKKGVLN